MRLNHTNESKQRIEERSERSKTLCVEERRLRQVPIPTHRFHAHIVHTHKHTHCTTSPLNPPQTRHTKHTHSDITDTHRRREETARDVGAGGQGEASTDPATSSSVQAKQRPKLRHTALLSAAHIHTPDTTAHGSGETRTQRVSGKHLETVNRAEGRPGAAVSRPAPPPSGTPTAQTTDSAKNTHNSRAEGAHDRQRHAQRRHGGQTTIRGRLDDPVLPGREIGPLSHLRQPLRPLLPSISASMACAELPLAVKGASSVVAAMLFFAAVRCVRCAETGA